MNLSQIDSLMSAVSPAGKFTTHPNLTVDVDGDVDFSSLRLNRIPVKFGTITGDLNLRGQRLQDLTGCPRVLGGTLILGADCSLRSLKGAPECFGDCLGAELFVLALFEEEDLTLDFVISKHHESRGGNTEQMDATSWRNVRMQCEAWLCKEFNSFSDAEIKNIEGIKLNKSSKLNKLLVTYAALRQLSSESVPTQRSRNRSTGSAP